VRGPHHAAVSGGVDHDAPVDVCSGNEPVVVFLAAQTGVVVDPVRGHHARRRLGTVRVPHGGFSRSCRLRPAPAGLSLFFIDRRGRGAAICSRFPYVPRVAIRLGRFRLAAARIVTCHVVIRIYSGLSFVINFVRAQNHFSLILHFLPKGRRITIGSEKRSHRFLPEMYIKQHVYRTTTN
jgi:hypothetical protein